MNLKNRKFIPTAIILITTSFGIPLFGNPVSPEKANEILKKHNLDSTMDLFESVEEIIFPPIYYSVMEMKTIEPGKRDKILELESYYAKNEGTFMEFLSPSRQKGIRVLQKESALWLYNPKSNSSRPIRLSPEDSFQGSVFSNNDIGDPRYSDDYSAEIVSIETLQHDELGELEVVTVVGTATHPKAPYGKIVMKIETGKLLPLSTRYYAKSGLLFKEMTFKDFTVMAGRVRPSVLWMDSLEIEGYHSVVTITRLDALDSIESWRFSENALTRR